MRRTPPTCSASVPKAQTFKKGMLNREGYISVAHQLRERFGCHKVAVTLRGSLSASDNDWSGTEAFFAPNHKIHIVDRVGGGDSFGGALIYTQLADYTNQKIIDFAVAASCLKHTIEQDFNLMSKQEVASLVAGNDSGRVER